jgi:hypothetical protein
MSKVSVDHGRHQITIHACKRGTNRVSYKAVAESAAMADLRLETLRAALKKGSYHGLLSERKEQPKPTTKIQGKPKSKG